MASTPLSRRVRAREFLAAGRTRFPTPEPSPSIENLRRAGIRAEMAYRGNMKRRMERANKTGARAAIILGDEELAKGVASVKDLTAGSQTEVALGDLAAHLAV